MFSLTKINSDLVGALENLQYPWIFASFCHCERSEAIPQPTTEIASGLRLSQ
jgi:hypothetical protein